MHAALASLNPYICETETLKGHNGQLSVILGGDSALQSKFSSLDSGCNIPAPPAAQRKVTFTEAEYKAHFEERKGSLAKLGAAFIHDSMVN